MAVASQSALPGDGLYPVKRGLESAHAELTFDRGDRGRVLLANARTRLDEAQTLSRTSADPARVDRRAERLHRRRRSPAPTCWSPTTRPPATGRRSPPSARSPWPAWTGSTSSSPRCRRSPSTRCCSAAQDRRPGAADVDPDLLGLRRARARLESRACSPSRPRPPSTPGSSPCPRRRHSTSRRVGTAARCCPTSRASCRPASVTDPDDSTASTRPADHRHRADRRRRPAHRPAPHRRADRQPAERRGLDGRRHRRQPARRGRPGRQRGRAGARRHRRRAAPAAPDVADPLPAQRPHAARCSQSADAVATLDSLSTRDAAERRRSAPDGRALPEQGVEGLLDRLAHLVGHVEDQHRVVGRAGVVLVGADRLAELQEPLRRQRAPARADRATGRTA